MADRRAERYDAFLAYSHGADGEIADLVARGLEIFGKARYQTRALRVFRDVTSLSASPGLWSGLEQALLSSRYLIVLLSPAGARSAWLNREIEFFRQHHDAERILLVVTDGSLAWDNRTGDFSPQSSAVPRALFGAFTEEPRWLDLSWAKQQEHLTVRNARLSDQLASLAAVLHEISKDELVGEYDRQYRRSRRVIAAVLVVLTFLLLCSVTLGLLLWQERRGAVHWPLSGGQLLWILAAVGVALLAAVAIRRGWRPVMRFPLRSPPDADDSSGYQGIVAATPAPPFPLWDYFRNWLRRRREIDLYIGPFDAADNDLAVRAAEVVRRLGQAHLRRGRLRVVVEMRPADRVNNLSASYEVALRARHYLHLGSPETVGAEAANLIIQEWLRVHPQEKLLLGIARLPEASGRDNGQSSSESVLPQVLRASGTGVSERTFDLRSFDPGREGAWQGPNDRGVSEMARLIGLLLDVDPHLVAHGGPAVLRVARRRSRIEEPLERWNLSETVQFRANAQIAVHLPEMQSAMAALGQSPLAYFRDLLASEEELIAGEIVTRAAEMLAQADRNAARETWIRVGRPRRRGPAAALVGPAAVLATAVGMIGIVGSVASGAAALLYPAVAMTALGILTVAATFVANWRASRFEVRRQKAFMSRYAEAVAAAAEGLQDGLQETVILPFLRQRLNEELTAAETVIALRYDPTVLTSQTFDRFRLETTAYLRLAARIEAPGGGAIGLAGPRGVGKTTLLSSLTRTRLFHHPESPGSQIGVLVSAPVRYDSVEFITQILAAVCREVIHAGGPTQRLTPPGYLAGTASAVRRTAAGVLLVSALAAIPVALGWLEVNRRQLVLLGLAALAVISAAVLFDAVGVARRIDRRFRYTSAAATGSAIARSSGQRIRDLIGAAGTILNRLYFREERSLSAGLKLPIPLGIEANGSGNLLYEGRPWTTPEIVQQFRQFAGALNDSGYRVIIAIDELDKVDDDEEVIRLLNDIKALFGLTNCYFLIAVSISAMVRFQQRGLPFQDAFESALEEVIYVEPLTATETVELLQRRLTGIPTTAALVCHVLGAGLPRDIIRALRNLVGSAAQDSPAALRALVIDDLHMRLMAERTRLQLAGRDTTEPVRRILDLTQLPFDSRKWLEMLDPMLDEVWQRLQPASQAESSGEVHAEDREHDRLMLFISWALTAAEFTTAISSGSDGDVVAQTTLAQDLATCRRLLAVDLRDAFVSLNQIRATLGTTAQP